MINTSGFHVSNLSQYTPVNPSLVAFNPTEVSDGMLKAFRISNALEELKASKAKQAELEATKQARIAAQNAQNMDVVAKTSAMGRTYEAQANDILGGFNFNENVRPFQQSAAISGLRRADQQSILDRLFAPKADELRTAEANSALSLLPKKTSAAAAKLALDEDSAIAARDNIPFTSEAERAAVILSSNKARAAIPNVKAAAELDAAKTQLGLNKTNYELDNAGVFNQEGLSQFIEQGRNLKARTDALLAEADLKDAQTGVVAPKGQERISAQLDALRKRQKDILDIRVLSPSGDTMSGNVLSYWQEWGKRGITPNSTQADIDKANGTWLTKDWSFDAKMADLLKEYIQIQGDMQHLQSQLPGLRGQPQQAPQVGGGGKALTSEDIKNKWLK